MEDVLGSLAPAGAAGTATHSPATSLEHFVAEAGGRVVTNLQKGTGTIFDCERNIIHVAIYPMKEFFSSIRFFPLSLIQPFRSEWNRILFIC